MWKTNSHFSPFLKEKCVSIVFFHWDITFWFIKPSFHKPISIWFVVRHLSNQQHSHKVDVNFIKIYQIIWICKSRISRGVCCVFKYDFNVNGFNFNCGFIKHQGKHWFLLWSVKIKALGNCVHRHTITLQSLILIFRQLQNVAVWILFHVVRSLPFCAPVYLWWI